MKKKIRADILVCHEAPSSYRHGFNAIDELAEAIGAKRIFGLFGFKLGYLKYFNNLSESPLEIYESCDSNRLYDNGYTQRIAPFPYFDSYAVDVPNDIQ